MKIKADLDGRIPNFGSVGDYNLQHHTKEIYESNYKRLRNIEGKIQRVHNNI